MWVDWVSLFFCLLIVYSYGVCRELLLLFERHIEGVILVISFIDMKFASMKDRREILREFSSWFVDEVSVEDEACVSDCSNVLLCSGFAYQDKERMCEWMMKLTPS